MLIEKMISIYDFVCAIGETVDLVSPALNSHHQRVACIACNIALEMGLPNDEVQDIVLAARLHDIGAFLVEDRIRIKNIEPFESLNGELDYHALVGYELLKVFEPFARVAVLIKHHHRHFDESRHDIPIGSYIIHLADRVAALFDDDREIFKQVHEVLEKINRKKDVFHPGAVIALSRVIKLEYFWVEVSSASKASVLKRVRFSKEIMGLDTLRHFAKVIGHIIDFRSRFTATHSSGVAAVALELTTISGFSERECKLMEIASFMHDLGKLAVSNDILEKDGPLDEEEFNSIKKHTYYTFIILSRIEGFEDIAVWAAYHHERKDGNGYPFRVKGKDFSKLSRIMAVADVVTALTEDRPYRSGMSKERVIQVLFNMAESGGLDEGIVGLVNEHFSRINYVRARAQQEAQQEYMEFQNNLKNYSPLGKGRPDVMAA